MLIQITKKIKIIGQVDLFVRSDHDLGTALIYNDTFTQQSIDSPCICKVDDDDGGGEGEESEYGDEGDHQPRDEQGGGGARTSATADRYI